MCISIEAEEAKRPALRLITCQGGAPVNTHAAPLLTSLHRVAAAAQVHTPEPDDDQLTLPEVFIVELTAFLVALVLAASAGVLIGWGWQEYQNLPLASLLKALGSLAPAY